VIRMLARVALVLALVASVVSVAGRAQAQSPDLQFTTPTTRGPTTGQLSGPTITLSPAIVEPGQATIITFNNWEARLATVAVCGNLAKRGSADCNQVNSQGVTVSGIGKTAPITQLTVIPPTGTCPCVIRAASRDTDETAVAPIEIIGHPTGPIVDPRTGDFIQVALSTEPASMGFWSALRSSLGGPTDYDATVTVRNITTEAFQNIDVFGSVGRNPSEDLDVFEMVPGEIGPGQTWTGTDLVTLPSPVYGDYLWQVVGSGAGPVVRIDQSMRVVPWLLVVLLVALLIDLVLIVLRFVQRRIRRHEEELYGDVPDADGDDLGPGGPAAPVGAGVGAARAMPPPPPPPSVLVS